MLLIYPLPQLRCQVHRSLLRQWRSVQYFRRTLRWIDRFAFTDLQCSGSCTGASGISALIGAIIGAGGVGVVSILALRAMNEWKSKSEPEIRYWQ